MISLEYFLTVYNIRNIRRERKEMRKYYLFGLCAILLSVQLYFSYIIK